MALGVVLMAVFGLAGAWLVTRAGETVEVVAVARPLAYGQTITADDLTAASVVPDSALRPVPAADRELVVGKRAAVELRPGQLVTSDAVTAQVIPGVGEQLVVVPLKGDRLPARGLAPGDRVLVVGTPPAGADLPEGAPPAVEATVAAVGAPDANGVVVVDVIVPTSDGPVLAARAATGRVAVLVEHRGQ